MNRIFLMLVTVLLYMEIIYHVSCFGFTGMNPLLAIALGMIVAGVQTCLLGFPRKKVNKMMLWVFLAIDYFLFAAQLVYIKIFRQPLLLAAVANGGQDALTNYWREALTGILHASPYLLLLAVPLAVIWVLLKKEKIQLRRYTVKGYLTGGIVTLCSVLLYMCVLFAGMQFRTDYYEEYTEFFDPNTVIEKLGVVTAVQRDLLGGSVWQSDDMVEAFEELPDFEEPLLDQPADAGTEEQPDSSRSASGSEEAAEPIQELNVLPIPFQRIKAETEDKEIRRLTDYAMTFYPTRKNAYTGMFQGYNLIYITAEGFCPYAVDEKVTPTLYKLTHSGFVFSDYYVPLWQTSTSDGEYVNCTGLIPDQQFSFKRSEKNAMPFSLPAYFAKEGVNSRAYHNNTLSYYERYLTHPNLGYDFKASKLGDLEEKDWGDKIFAMEHPGEWPSSDLEMMQATIPEYINEERFHTYYMTVSGHMNYDFKGNKMSSKNKEAVAELPYSEEGKAYIACHVELDKALEYLITELEKAGKLKNTVICMSADHYPYAMKQSSLEELAGKSLADNHEVYKNYLVLWNSEMETVEIDKPCSSLDILPTLYNLFGFAYDSRLFAGKDILSDSEPLVIFSDRSFITDKVIYNRKEQTIVPRTEEEVSEQYMDIKKKQVKNLYNFSAGVLNSDYYKYVEEALEQ